MRYFLSLFLSLSVSMPIYLLAQEEITVAEAESTAASEAEEEVDSSQLTSRSKSYDAEAIGELFDEQRAQNKRIAEEMVPHFNVDQLDVITLAPVETDPYHLRNFDQLLDKIDPQPRRRLQRLAELDPIAAADLQVSMRADERFFAGEDDATFDRNAGRTANVDVLTLTSAIGSAITKAKESRKKKSVMDDQEAIDVSAPE